MGVGIASGVLGLGSSLIGGIFANKARKSAQEAALTGFNYLKDNANIGAAQTQGLEAQNLIAGLLGLGGDQAASDAAFQRFQDSSGYQFRLGQGLQGITGNAAAGGLLNSGAALKSLTGYSQGLASQEFQNYLSQLMGQAGAGLNAAQLVGSAGSSGGANAGAFGLQGASNVSDIFRQGVEDATYGFSSAYGAGQY